MLNRQNIDFNNHQEEINRNWKVISDLVLHTKRSDFLIWIKEMNPEFYKNLIEKGNDQKSNISRKISSQSVWTEENTEIELETSK